jgi:hypothetical protein
MSEFRNQLLALSSTAQVQIALFPKGVCIGDELVSDFDRNKQHFLANQQITSPQRNAIDALDAFITELSGPHNEVFWCDPEPLMDDPRWGQIRELSRTVLRALNWKYCPPTRNGAAYYFIDRVVENIDDDDIGTA